MKQMGKHYGLTGSKRPDAQAGMEAGITLAMGAAAGADIFGHMGICGVDQAASLDMLVLQNEIIGYVESTMREVRFSDEALGLDVVEEVGPGCNFIDTEHTFEHFRQELWIPQLLDREYYAAWLDAGATSMEDRCKARTRTIPEEHESEPISEDLDRALAEIVKGARQQ